MARLYSGETAKAVKNFPISGETVPAEVIHWLGRIKGAAATVNGDLDHDLGDDRVDLAGHDRGALL